jgi:hypothetical protein
MHSDKPAEQDNCIDFVSDSWQELVKVETGLSIDRFRIGKSVIVGASAICLIHVEIDILPLRGNYEFICMRYPRKVLIDIRLLIILSLSVFGDFVLQLEGGRLRDTEASRLRPASANSSGTCAGVHVNVESPNCVDAIGIRSFSRCGFYIYSR